jgi:hypothetical protein
MHYLFKGTAKYHPRSPGEVLRPFKPNPRASYTEQLQVWQSARQRMQAQSIESKKKRGGGSHMVSKREVLNLRNSLGRYWADR